MKEKLVWLLIPIFFIACNAKVCSQEKKKFVHDPVMIEMKGTYYLFSTGWGISVFSSKDMLDWKYQGPVFDKPPEWAIKSVPGFKGHIWAPDIIYQNGKYYLYYSVSAFGKNTSCIGVATNVTLNKDDQNYLWVDHGKVVQSVPGRDLWNAIDPNVAIDDQGDAWMTFGSFWQGMKLVKLDSTILEIEKPEQWFTIARRDRSPEISDPDPGDGAIEAPFIFKKHGYYYLFVSWDYCCRGLESNYKIVAGRSKTITGPYLDKNGIDMFLGGGSPILSGNEKYSGVGHNSVYTFNDNDYLVCHAYDIADDGKPKLRILLLKWDEEGWPDIESSSELDCKIIN